MQPLQLSPAIFVRKVLELCSAGTHHRTDEFLQNRVLKLSAQKSLEIIGEAANSLSDTMREKYPDIPWDIMRGLRNRLTHRYFDVSWSIVWEIIQTDIPSLKIQIEQIIEVEGYRV